MSSLKCLPGCGKAPGLETLSSDSAMNWLRPSTPDPGRIEDVLGKRLSRLPHVDSIELSNLGEARFHAAVFLAKRQFIIQHQGKAVLNVNLTRAILESCDH